MADDIWLLGLALGLTVDAGLLLGLALSGAPVRLPDDLPRLATIAVAIAVLCWQGLPVVVSFGRAGLRGLWWYLERREAARIARRDSKTPLPAPPGPVQVIRAVPYHVNGEPSELPIPDTRSARWYGWQSAAVRVCGWYAARRSLTADALAPGAVADRSDWVALTDELARVGLVVKRNGQRTVWADPFPVVRARIESGTVEWTGDADAPAVAEPPALPSGVVVESGARSPESSAFGKAQ